MRAKQYYEPIVNPLMQEGGQRFADFFGAIPQGLAQNQGGIGQMTPEAAWGNVMSDLARKGGLYESNLGLRSYFDTRAENLGNLGLQDLNTRYGRLADQYGRVYGAERNAVADDQWRQNFALDQQKLAAARASSGPTYDFQKIIDTYLKQLAMKAPPAQASVGGATAGLGFLTR